jgi:hypothetical protein
VMDVSATFVATILFRCPALSHSMSVKLPL